MQNDNYLGKSIVNEIICTKQPDGFWNVLSKVTQKRTLDLDSEWEARHLEITGYGKNIEDAMAECNMSIAQYLSTVGYDLFNVVEDTEELSD